MSGSDAAQRGDAPPGPASRPLAAPLSGIKVLEAGQGWSSALAGRLLADLGATVTKVEVPWGDALRDFGRDAAEGAAAFLMATTGKTMLPREPDEKRWSDELRGLAQDHDVTLIDHDVVRSLGFDLEEIGGRTVVCRFAPFDPRGTLADRVTNDLVLQALSGVMATTGWPGGRALRSGTEISSVVGALYGVIGVLASLIERERSGRGQLIDVSLYDCLVSTLTNFASRVLAGVEPLDRLGNQGPNSAPWELFETADDKYVFIIAGSPPTFERLAKSMGRPELPTDPRFTDSHKRRENYRAITDEVAAWTRTLPRQEIIELLRSSGVPVSPVATIEDLLAEPHLASRDMRVVLQDDAGREMVAPGAPLGIRSEGPEGATSGPRLDGSTVPPGSPPLSGVRVVDFGNLTAGPFCTRLLANLGAEVLKIEPMHGETGRQMPAFVDGESVFFHITNNGKRSVRVNLREPADVALVSTVLAGADIVVENQAPGTLAKRGLGPEDVLRRAPGLVYTSVSGYGHRGALGGLRAYDTVIQAGAGLMSLTGEEGQRPLKTGISTADVLGALASTSASLAAYFGRLTGRHGGVALDVALFDICAWSTQMAWISHRSPNGSATRHGNGHWIFAPYGTHATFDGRCVAVACESDEQWRHLCALLRDDFEGPLPPGLEQWSTSTRRERARDLEALLDTYCESRSAHDLVGALQQAGVPSGEVLEVFEVLTSREDLAPTTVVTTPRDGNSWRVTEFPIRLRRTPGAVTSPGPLLGLEDAKIRQDPQKAWINVFTSQEAIHA